MYAANSRGKVFHRFHGLKGFINSAALSHIGDRLLVSRYISMVVSLGVQR